MHCKNYSNVHIKSQNYSCVLDSHTCLGDRISCCRKISGDKSKIKAVILMEIIKTTESRSQIYTGIFLSLSLWQWKKNYINSILCLIDREYCLIDREYCQCNLFSLSKWQGKKYAGVNLTPKLCCFNFSIKTTAFIFDLLQEIFLQQKFLYPKQGWLSRRQE